MDITTHSAYFQKSRVFLYSTLGFPRGGIVPMETFARWKDYYDFNEAKLSLLYQLYDDTAFRTFEEKYLLSHKQFHDFQKLDDAVGVYVFDFKCEEKNWQWFLKSRYSFFTDEYKKKILSTYNSKSDVYPYIESFLYPEKYYKMYSDLLGVEYVTLHLVGELCTKIDPTKETLECSVMCFNQIK